MAARSPLSLLRHPFGLPLLCLLNFLFASYVFYWHRWPCRLLESQFVAMRKGVIHLTQTFDRHDVPYILYEGTLLGLVRDKDIIPWDTDIDLALVRPIDDRFRAAMRDPILLERLTPVEHPGCWKVYTNDRFNQSDAWRFIYKRTYVDICLLSAESQASEPEVVQGGNRSRITVWGHQFSVPANVNRALTFMYGSTYMTPDPGNDRGAGFNDFPSACPYFARRFILLSALSAFCFALVAHSLAHFTQTIPWRVFTLWSALLVAFFGLLSLFLLVVESWGL